ncbi:hypothetical protein E2I00_017689, partial [Balaenoptera physalus]
SSDGGAEPSALADDNGSEEDYSYEDLCRASPRYLQPGGEQLAINEVRGLIPHGSSRGRRPGFQGPEPTRTLLSDYFLELGFKAGDVIQVLEASHKDWWWGRSADREAWFPASFVRGYIRQCRKHTAMFTVAQLATIFGNIEDIYKFQRKFLKDLEKQYNKEEPHLSEIGSCFLQHRYGGCGTGADPRGNVFKRLETLLLVVSSWRGARCVVKINPSLCSDYSNIKAAYEAMKNVACLINERKRKLESIDKIARWQVSIVGWEGQDILERSSELIHSGELTRVTRQGKSQQRTFFLFDHQLVACKKDLLRRDVLYYRGRTDMDAVELVDLEDGRDGARTLGVRNAFKLVSRTGDEAHLFCAKKPEDKARWLQACRDERRRVQEDRAMGMEISENQKKLAMLNAQKAGHGNLRPVHQRHVTVPASLPQQQVFALAEPKRKPSLFWHTFNKLTPFRK